MLQPCHPASEAVLAALLAASHCVAPLATTSALLTLSGAVSSALGVPGSVHVGATGPVIGVFA